MRSDFFENSPDFSKNFPDFGSDTTGKLGIINLSSYNSMIYVSMIPRSLGYILFVNYVALSEKYVVKVFSSSKLQLVFRRGYNFSGLNYSQYFVKFFLRKLF